MLAIAPGGVPFSASVQRLASVAKPPNATSCASPPLYTKTAIDRPSLNSTFPGKPRSGAFDT